MRGLSLSALGKQASGANDECSTSSAKQRTKACFQMNREFFQDLAHKFHAGWHDCQSCTVAVTKGNITFVVCIVGINADATKLRRAFVFHGFPRIFFRGFSINRFFLHNVCANDPHIRGKKSWQSHVTLYLVTVIVARPGYAYAIA